MKLSEIKKLKTYDDDVQKKIIRQVKSKFGILKGRYGIIQASTGVGKTHLAIQNMPVIFYEVLGCRVFFFLAPQDSLISHSGLGKHIKEMKRTLQKVSPGIIVEELFKPSVGEIQQRLNRRESGDVVFVTMSDKFWNNNESFIVQMIKSNKLEWKVLSEFDEAHVGSTSDVKYYHNNKGYINYKYNAVKYKNIIDYSEVGYAIGYTGSPSPEQKDVDFGSDKYLILNTFPKKEELWKRTACYQEPIFFNQDEWGMEKSLLKFIEKVEVRQMELDNLADELDLPEECRIKLAGGIKLQTPYKEAKRFDTKQLRNILGSDISVNSHWDFDMALDTSKEFEVWRVQGGSITKLTKEEREESSYFDSDMLIEKMKDSKSKLKFLILVSKGNMGIDIPNWIGSITLRTFTAENTEREPMTEAGIQWNGRGSRPAVPIEVLSPHFKDKEKFVEYNMLVNSHFVMVPDTEYWRVVMSDVSEQSNSVDEVRRKFNS
jgi:hypothetical protein